MEEVHLWRGTQEQQSLRASFRKSGQFSYFNRQLGQPDWDTKTVLDFGGNQGNLLRDSAGRIRPANYYCVDVLKEAIAEGSQQFPDAHFRHYDRFNCSFNPTGTIDEPIPEFDISFDIIVAYSVFTHTTREEMHELVNRLLQHLTPEGTLAFTFIDPHSSDGPAVGKGTNLQWRLERMRELHPAIDVATLLETSRRADWCALVNSDQLHVNSNGVSDTVSEGLMTYHVYYTVDFLQKEFPQATIQRPVDNEMHHCCLVRAGA